MPIILVYAYVLTPGNVVYACKYYITIIYTSYFQAAWYMEAAGFHN